MRNRYRSVLLVLLLFAPSASIAGDPILEALERSPHLGTLIEFQSPPTHGLAGLDTLGVGGNTAIQGFDDGAHELSTQLMDDARLILRQAGIAVPLGTSSFYLDGEAVPNLEINVSIGYDENFGAYDYSVDVKLEQRVTTGQGEKIRAATWDAQVAGIASKDEMPEAVRVRLKRLVGLFVKAYQAENPNGG